MSRPGRENFEQLVHAHHAAVYRSALRIAGDSGAAADVAQDVFLRVLGGKVRLDDARSARATLCWLAARLAQNAVRSRRRRRRHEENAMADSSRPDRHDPAAAAGSADLRAALQHAVAALPAELRVPLELHCQEDLTLAAVGSALRLSTSTVHDRVQRALARLREALARRGFAPGLAVLPGLLGQLPPPDVPAGLAARLLSAAPPAVDAPLASAGAVRRLALALGLGGAALGVAVASAEWTARGAEPPAASAVRAPALAAEGPAALPAPERRLAAVAPQDPKPAPPADHWPLRLAGTVRDAAASPVAGVEVAAVAAGNLKPFELGRATTDASGRFVFAAEHRGLSPRAVRVVVREQSTELMTSDEIEVPLAAAAGPLDLVLPAAVGLESDRFEWWIEVVDRAGAPLAGVTATIFRGPPGAAGRVEGIREATAATGADGAAVLRGRSLGDKLLLVDGQPLGMAQIVAAVALERGGLHRRRVVLPAGAALEVQVSGLDGRVPEGCSVGLEDERTGLRIGSRPADGAGAVCFTGLGDGPYTLHARAGPEWSPAARRGCRAADGKLVVRLKPRAETRDIGDHMAELHGTVVDAATGEPVPLGAFAIEVLRACVGESSSPFDRLVPPPPVQRAAAFGDTRTTNTFAEVGLGPGRHGLVVDVDGYALAVHECDLRDGELRSGIEIALQRGATVSGRALGPDGAPAPAALVFVIGVGALADEQLAAWSRTAPAAAPGKPAPSVLACRTRAGPDGSFRLARVPPGVELRLIARGVGGTLATLPLGVLRAGEAVAGRELRLP